MIPKMSTSVPDLTGKGGCWCGRRGLPAAAIEQMYADYQRLGSLAKVGALHGRTRQSMFELFKHRGLKLNAKKFLPVVIWQGKKYTEQKTAGRHRYLRATVGRKETFYLHHVIWEQAHGPIPAGHKLAFKDGNHRNCELANLELLTNSAQVSKHATGHNQFTRTARARLEALLNDSKPGLLATIKRKHYEKR